MQQKEARMQKQKNRASGERGKEKLWKKCWCKKAMSINSWFKLIYIFIKLEEEPNCSKRERNLNLDSVAFQRSLLIYAPVN